MIFANFVQTVDAPVYYIPKAFSDSTSLIYNLKESSKGGTRGTSELFLDSAEDCDALSWERLWRYVFRLAAQDSKKRMFNYFSSVEILQTIS